MFIVDFFLMKKQIQIAGSILCAKLEPKAR
jgi:hypothetical protein